MITVTSAQTHRAARVLLASAAGGFDAVISLRRMGTDDLGVEHIRVWLVDAGPDRNPNLEFVLDDTARMITTLRGEGKRVLLHCVEGRSRTPSVAARYSILLGGDPREGLTAMDWARPDHTLWLAATHGEPAVPHRP